VFLCFSVYLTNKRTGTPMIEGMAKVTVTLYMDETDKEALQQLADAEERSLSQMAVLILKQAIRQAKKEGKIQSGGEESS
jgi:hypothetical protein